MNTTTTLKRSDRGRLVLGQVQPQVRLARAIEAHELSKRRIIDAVGITRQGAQAIIKGVARPREGLADRFCEVLGLPWNDVWTYERKPEDPS